MGDTPVVQSAFYFSSELQSKGPLELLRRLVEAGADFSEIGTDLKIGNILEKYLAEPSEEWFQFTINDNTYTLTVVKEPGHLLFVGAIDFVDPIRNQQVAVNLIPPARMAMETFAFKYGYVDIQGGKSLSEKEVLASKLTRIFKVNIFGSPYVDKYGKAFLMGAPGWKISELAGGALEYITTKDVLVPIDKTLEQEIIQYFAPKAKVRIHKPAPFEP